MRTYVEPGLAGLLDGPVSTLGPIFAAAFATQNPLQTFKVGLAASLGAGISMAFTEVASDDGTLTGRGSPMTRGLVIGLMTLLGGMGHTLPFLIPHFLIATAVAFAVVFFELWAIAFIKYRFMNSALGPAIVQVVIGGVLVFVVGVLVGGV